MRFRKADLPRLLTALRIPETVHLGNRIRVNGEEALCVLLTRMAYPCTYNALAAIFGRERSIVCRLFRGTLDHVFETQKHRLQDYLGFWAPKFHYLSCCIDRKRMASGLPDNMIEESHKRVVGFIDGTLRACSRPKAVGGFDIQRQCYNGWKKKHAIKFQAVEGPNGMTLDLYGPVTGSHNDNFLLRMSEITQRMQNYPDAQRYRIYGDSAYPMGEHITRPYKNPVDGQGFINSVMSELRICVEWGFARNVNLFAYCDYPKGLHLLSTPIGRVYVVAVLLRNANNALYGGETSRYFDCLPPTLEEYFQV